MSKREELANLLARQNGYTSLLAMPASQRDNWRKRADAVLDALMEPTEGIQEMGNYAYNLTGLSGASGFPASSEEHTAFIWQAMIQAARDGK